MTRIGEETGNMEEMLEKVADYYDEEVEAATQAVIGDYGTSYHHFDGSNCGPDYVSDYGTDDEYLQYGRECVNRELNDVL